MPWDIYDGIQAKLSMLVKTMIREVKLTMVVVVMMSVKEKKTKKARKVMSCRTAP